MSRSPAATAASQGQSVGSWTAYEANLGSAPLREGTFTITDAGVTASSKVLVNQAIGPYTGKGTLADEAVMDQLLCVAEPAAGTATVYFRVMDGGRVKGNVKFFYTVI